MAKQNYVVAVSGGVDSIVLLDALVKKRLSELANYQLPTTNYQLIVAHLDHGIRVDAASDAAFVGELAQRYGLPYETERAELGRGASEAKARQVRYDFLRRCCEKYKAILITAHHQDDVLETMMINLLRGTGWRGLAPMADKTPNFKSQASNSEQNLRNKEILRPLLTTPKATLLEYAKKYSLQWREDSTNSDVAYLRNYIRLKLLPHMLQKNPNAKEDLLTIYSRVVELKSEIAIELQKLLPLCTPDMQSYELSRYQATMWPDAVAKEVIYYLLTNLDPAWHPGRVHVERVLHFVKTGRPHKELVVSGSLKVVSLPHVLRFQKY